jgi:hypothetical protein
LTPALLLVLLVGLAAVWLERSDRLPEPISTIVREAEVRVLDPILKDLGIELPSAGSSPPVPDESLDLAEARGLLEQLRVEPEHNSDYRREDWPHWLDLDGNCLDAREEVLIAESVTPASLSRNGCRVLAGRWTDPYTGETLTKPAEIDIDHVVALEEAHGSGGHAWTRERRAAFANDLSDPRALVAATASANRAKGSLGPEDWLPPDPRARCRYVADWIVIKARWDLSMDERERISVGNILTACTTGPVTTSGISRR